MNATQGNARIGSESILVFQCIATNLDASIAMCRMAMRSILRSRLKTQRVDQSVQAHQIDHNIYKLLVKLRPSHNEIVANELNGTRMNEHDIRTHSNIILIC